VDRAEHPRDVAGVEGGDPICNQIGSLPRHNL
jgi:hypothetical protein